MTPNIIKNLVRKTNSQFESRNSYKNFKFKGEHARQDSMEPWEETAAVKPTVLER